MLNEVLREKARQWTIFLIWSFAEIGDSGESNGPTYSKLHNLLQKN